MLSLLPAEPLGGDCLDLERNEPFTAVAQPGWVHRVPADLRGSASNRKNRIRVPEHVLRDPDTRPDREIRRA
ncbi:hypothetical protein SAMN02787118_111311 [Streptomyces mirabilis]|uniref:Uncharacterized protein n=1 Tax=Streptomyces mirabilis TaxID=68239 RepID=A0A1I2L7T2_9ACTN|nr:hypothetical protein SAMN02787118_111311 [Streptomyces mirabilis]